MTVVVLMAAYLVAGVAYVVGDIGEHVIRQTAYAREYTQRGRIGPAIVAAIAWMPFAVSRRRWGPILIFVFLAAVGAAVFV